MTVTVKEDGILPSKGLLYSKPFDPHIELRSMTVADEMKRQQPTTRPYQVMAEIIEDCLITKLPIPVYDLVFGDYVYLLHKLRSVSYGDGYNFIYSCPICGNIEKVDFDLGTLNKLEYTDDLAKYATVELPVSKKIVTLRLQTPRDLDDIKEKAKDMKEQFPDMKGDPSILFELESYIGAINGQPVNKMLIKEELKAMAVADYNVLDKAAKVFNKKVGIDDIINIKCSKCGNTVPTTFPYTNQFIRPEV